MKKRIFKIFMIFALSLSLQGCFMGTGYFDAPFFGEITLGTLSFDMLSTDEEIREIGFDSKISSLSRYEDDNTNDEMYYNVYDSDSFYEVRFMTNNTTYQEYGCGDCDNFVSKYVRLPKNITYESTVEDVIKAYGEPTVNEQKKDNNEGGYINDNTGEYFYMDCYYLRYEVEKEDSFINLELYFDANDKKLYKVEYVAEVVK